MLPKELLSEIKKIEIKTRHLVDSVYAGGYRSVFKGRGIEFAAIREYYRGDEYRSIDWKVTARTNALHVREHHEERELQLMVALDLSGSMSFGTGTREKRESAVELAAAMTMAAAENNDRAGICLFTNTVEKYIAPAKGRSHILRLIKELLYFVPREKTSDLKPVLHLLNHSLRHRAIVFLITDGLGFGPMEREFAITAARHDLILVTVKDPREEGVFDIGLVEIEDPETGEESVWDTSQTDLTRDIFQQAGAERARLRNLCRKIGVDTVEILAGESVVKPICQLFAQRESRLRT